MFKSKPLLITIAISLIPLFSLLRPGMFAAHDSVSHVVRVASFYQSLTEGNLFPRWSQTLNAGYGHPIFMFLYPFASYFTALFHLFGFNFVVSLKLVLATSYILAGAFMYLWLKRHFSSSAALAGAAVFQLAPYRFVDLYVRNALGEHVAFMFVPLVFLSLYFLVTKPSLVKISLTSLALAGLITAHNAVSLMFLPLALAYTLILLFQNRKQKLLSLISYLLVAGIFGFSLSAFFWIPALIEGKYTLRNVIMQDEAFTDHFSSLKQLVLPNWGYGVSYSGLDDNLSLQIGIIQWLSAAAGSILLFSNWRKIKLEIKLIACLTLFAFTFTTFLMHKASLPLWHIIPFIKKFQFPWRFLIVPTFSSGILLAFFIHQKKLKFFVLLIILGLLIQNHCYWKPKQETLLPEEQVIKSYTGTTDTGESTPMWAVRFQEIPPKDTLEVVWGAPIQYQIHNRQSEIHEHTITATVKTQVSENTLYFPGWTVYVDGQKKGIIWTDPNWRGVITYPVPPGTHSVRVVFEETKLRKFSNAISIISALFIIFLIFWPPKLLTKKIRK